MVNHDVKYIFNPFKINIVKQGAIKALHRSHEFLAQGYVCFSYLAEWNYLSNAIQGTLSIVNFIAKEQLCVFIFNLDQSKKLPTLALVVILFGQPFDLLIKGITSNPYYIFKKLGPGSRGTSIKIFSPFFFFFLALMTNLFI